MTRRLQIALLLLVAAAFAGETIDRIVVTVNKRIILASQWDQAIRFEALGEGKQLKSVTDAEQEQTLDRLIDQQLLQEEIAQTTYKSASPDEVTAAVGQFRQQVAPGSDDAKWRALLGRYGLDDEDVRERITAQLDILRFIDLRFKPSIHIDPRNVTAYYRNTVVPQAEGRGQRPPTLEEARPTIEQILVQQRIDDLLGAYLKNLRAQARIQRLDKEAKGQ